MTIWIAIWWIIRLIVLPVWTFEKTKQHNYPLLARYLWIFATLVGSFWAIGVLYFWCWYKRPKVDPQ